MIPNEPALTEITPAPPRCHHPKEPVPIGEDVVMYCPLCQLSWPIQVPQRFHVGGNR